MDWLKIGSGILIIAMMIYIWPSAKHMLNNSPDDLYLRSGRQSWIFDSAGVTTSCSGATGVCN